MTEVKTIMQHASHVRPRFLSFNVQFLASLRVNQVVGFTISFYVLQIYEECRR